MTAVDTRAPAARPAVAALGLLAALYIAQSLPMYFFNVAMPAVLRSRGVALQWIGLLSLLYLPWALKFLWAPAVDRWGHGASGRWRRGLVVLQCVLAACMAGLAFAPLWQWPVVFVVLGFTASLAAATQDIAVDGYAVERFATQEQGWAAYTQGVGTALGSAIGGAGILWVYERAGWQPALLVLALLVLLSCVAPLRLPPRPARPQVRASLRAAWQRPAMRRMLLLVVVYRLVEAPAMAMLNPVLVDQGWSLTHIGLLLTLGAATVGLAAGAWTARGVRRDGAPAWLMRTVWLRSVIYAVLAALLLADVLQAWVWGVVVVLLMAVRYMAMVALYASFLQHSSKDQAGTDFTLLACAELLVFLVGASGSGFLAAHVGYGLFYGLLTAVSLLSLWGVARLLRTAPPPQDGLAAAGT